MTATTVSDAVATRETGPGQLVQQYSSSFAQVLPTHVKPETFVRLAQEAHARGLVVGASDS